MSARVRTSLQKTSTTFCAKRPAAPRNSTTPSRPPGCCFLKYLDGLEQDLADEAALAGKRYSYILDKAYRWESWAAPKGKDGQLDHNTALTGDDLRDFVNGKLFPYLHGFTQRATGPDTIEYKIGQIFGEIKNKIQSVYNMREIIDHVDALRFPLGRPRNTSFPTSTKPKSATWATPGANGGEYYTPRAR